MATQAQKSSSKVQDNPLMGKFTLRFKKDNPWLVREKLYKDQYVPRLTKTFVEVDEDVYEPVRMKAHEARAINIEIPLGIPDDQYVDVELKKTIKVEEKRYIFLLHDRAKYDKEHRIISRPRYSKNRSERVELAEVRKDPLSFINVDKFVELIEDEIDFWTTEPMNGTHIEPRLLCLLAINDRGKEITTLRRELFYIQRYWSDKMIIVDSQNRRYMLEITTEARKKCRTLSFIMFVPSNGFIVDLKSGKTIA